MNSFEFAVVSALRSAQLQRGCTPRVVQSAKVEVTAQQEIAQGKVLPFYTPVSTHSPAKDHYTAPATLPWSVP
jgi:hypothetical protein